LIPKFVKAVLYGEFFDELIKLVGRPLGLLARKSGEKYYFGLALVFILIALVVSVVNYLQGDVKTQSLDLAVKYRISSPSPDSKVVILDIDEKSLSMMSDKYGRWPWPRVVLAEALANLSDAGASAVLLNIMLSDPDKSNPGSDITFNEIAGGTPNIVHPLIRLNSANDHLSQITVGMLPNARPIKPNPVDSKIAVIIPFFSGSHDKLAVSNLKSDSDGMVRSFPILWKEGDFFLPSNAARAVEITSKHALKDLPNEILLNWRNKKGTYERISFSDFFDPSSSSVSIDKATFKNSIVVMGVSAPGISTTKTTPVNLLTDDNQIIANAIDDIKNRTYLRLLPSWLIGLFSIGIICCLTKAFVAGVSPKKINRWFSFAQLSLVLITIGSASFSNYLVDLSSCFFLAMGYFLFAKVHLAVEQNASRGAAHFVNLGNIAKEFKQICVVALDAKKSNYYEIAECKKKLESTFGISKVFYIDNIFSSDNLISIACKNFKFFVLFIHEKKETSNFSLENIQATHKLLTNSVSIRADFDEDTQHEREQISEIVSELLMRASVKILESKSATT
jgi:CHASE2 domain-containing sensor protein